MKKLILLTVIALFAITFINAQSVGINTTGATPNPTALLHVDLGTSTTKGLLVTGTNNPPMSNVPNLGAGSRLMFYPARAAFRAGFVSGSQWDNANVGQYSTAMGAGTIASGFVTIAMGIETTASGNNSTAMGGYASTNLKAGTFVYGDNSTTTVMNSTADNQFMVRAAGGTIFYSNSTLTAGVTLPANGNSWVSICDKNRKENFETLDGEDVLQKISNLNFTSWNYKMQDPKTYRHYGIMAQDFYKAFGHDKYGTIGNDSTVNPIDMIGIDMTAIQALGKRTTELKNEMSEVKHENAMLNKENESLKQSVAKLQIQFDQQQKLIAQSLDQLKTLALKQVVKETVAVK